jgi:hypothetical protein
MKEKKKLPQGATRWNSVFTRAEDEETMQPPPPDDKTKRTPEAFDKAASTQSIEEAYQQIRMKKLEDKAPADPPQLVLPPAATKPPPFTGLLWACELALDLSQDDQETWNIEDAAAEPTDLEKEEAFTRYIEDLQVTDPKAQQEGDRALILRWEEFKTHKIILEDLSTRVQHKREELRELINAQVRIINLRRLLQEMINASEVEPQAPQRRNKCLKKDLGI